VDLNGHGAGYHRRRFIHISKSAAINLPSHPFPHLAWELGVPHR
jgi:hypothetical protein